MLVVTLLAALQGLPPSAGDSLASVSIVVNIPAYRLDLLDSGRVVARFPVAVGLPDYPTPPGRFLVTRVELNPSWTPPRSPWAAGRSPMPPGPANPMGRAKMMLMPQYYLHGTPDSLSVGSAASHGCIRLRNRDVLQIARRLLASEAPGLADSVEAIVGDARKSRAITLARAVPVEVRYDLMEVIDGIEITHPDLYSRGAKPAPACKPSPRGPP